MTNVSFFLKDIDNDEYIETLSHEKQNELNNYLEDMSCGPGDGCMDIDWHDEGRSYYHHDHILYSIKDPEEKKKYLLDLKVDIDEWLIRAPNHYVVNRVKEIFSKELSLLN